MVQFLVRLLDMGLETVDKPAATKAQIVKALKAMARSLKYGEKVSILKWFIHRYLIFKLQNAWKSRKHTILVLC